MADDQATIISRKRGSLRIVVAICCDAIVAGALLPPVIMGVPRWVPTDIVVVIWTSFSFIGLFTFLKPSFSRSYINIYSTFVIKD